MSTPSNTHEHPFQYEKFRSPKNEIECCLGLTMFNTLRPTYWVYLHPKEKNIPHFCLAINFPNINKIIKKKKELLLFFK